MEKASGITAGRRESATPSELIKLRGSDQQLSMKRKSQSDGQKNDDDGSSDSNRIFAENSAEAVWIRSNLKRRHCTKFVLNKTDASGLKICKCGLPEGGSHKEVGELNWSFSANTVATEATNAYGQIDFIGHTTGSISKYARVDVDTDMNVVIDLLIKQWKLQRPNLILTVTGGAKAFELRENLKRMFRKGLMKAAQSTGAWIITGGMDAGVMSHVGEAVRDYTDTDSAPIVCLGIAPWGCVAHTEEYLVNPMGKWPAKYAKDELTNPNSSHIDSNHTHFIFVDNGTSGIFGTEIEFRAHLESVISAMKQDEESSDSANIPLCCVVLEGGPGTLETVRSSLEMGSPVVIIDGSGRAANILSYAFLNSTEDEVEEYDKEGRKQIRVASKISDTLRSELYDMLKEMFGKNNIDQYLDSVERCMAYRDLITIFNFEDRYVDARDLDVAILKALMKANKNQFIDQLKLALTWSRVDVAEREIFTEDRKWKTGDLDDLFYRALIIDNVDFVKLFMKNGVILSEFLSIERIIKLYNNIKPTDPGKVLINRLFLSKRKSNQRYISLENVGDTIIDLIGEFYRSVYKKDLRYRDLDCDAIMTGNFENEDDISDEVKDRLIVARDTKKAIYVTDTRYENKTMKLPHFDDPARELFLWSVLSGRHEMSLIFWEEVKESIAGALAAERMFNQLSNKTDDSEIKEVYKNNAEEYGELAIGVLQECFTTDVTKSQLLLIRKSNGFGNTTCLQLAEEGNNLKFISHSAPQTLLNNIWMGRMTIENNSTIKIFLAIFSIILLPVWPLIVNLLINFNDDQVQKEDDLASGEVAEQNTAENDEDNVEFIKSNKKSNMLIKFFAFLNAPIIKFSFNCIFYILFLSLFSFILLCHFKEQISPEEIILIIWVFSLISEELRQVFFTTEATFKARAYVYFTDLWNIMDLICVGMFILGEILRSVDNEECFTAGRIILAFDLLLFNGRMMYLFSVHPKLGPKLVMIFRMMIDMTYFVVILLVFVTAYGIALHVVLYRNSEKEWKLLTDILKKSYFQMYGELFLDELEGGQPCTTEYALSINGTLPHCPTEEGKILSPIMLGIYILMTNILMFNLLIAMFSFTFDKINSNTKAIWRFQRLSLIREFTERPLLPPPFIFINHVYIFIRVLFSSCFPYKSKSPFKHKFPDTRNKQLVTWENRNADEYVKQRHDNLHETSDYVIKKLQHRLIRLDDKVDLMLENFSTNNSTLGSTSSLGSSMVANSELNQRLMSLDAKIDSYMEMLTLTLKSAQGSKVDLSQITNRTSGRKESSSFEKDGVSSLSKVKHYNHIHARSNPYTLTNIRRQEVSDKQVDWKTLFPNYSPTNFTHDIILAKPPYADPDLLSQTPPHRDVLAYNKFDEKYQIDRKSYVSVYQVVNGIPLNPMGRTGLAGRGRLGRFGPNHAADCVVSRWKRNSKDEVIKLNGLPMLEVVMVMRDDGKRWALPGAIVTNSNNHKSLCEILKNTFVNEAGNKLSNIDFDEFFDEKNGTEIFVGYVDDPRNTDNSWMETKAINFHDSTGKNTSNINLKAGGSNVAVRWMTISSEEAVYASHIRILEALANHHGAFFKMM